ncbi:hypothetical protein JZ751_007635, partial [Albula glossodonta]
MLPSRSDVSADIKVSAAQIPAANEATVRVQASPTGRGGLRAETRNNFIWRCADSHSCLSAVLRECLRETLITSFPLADFPKKSGATHEPRPSLSRQNRSVRRAAALGFHRHATASSERERALCHTLRQLSVSSKVSFGYNHVRWWMRLDLWRPGLSVERVQDGDRGLGAVPEAKGRELEFLTACRELMKDRFPSLSAKREPDAFHLPPPHLQVRCVGLLQRHTMGRGGESVCEVWAAGGVGSSGELPGRLLCLWCPGLLRPPQIVTGERLEMRMKDPGLAPAYITARVKILAGASHQEGRGGERGFSQLKTDEKDKASRVLLRCPGPCSCSTPFLPAQVAC